MNNESQFLIHHQFFILLILSDFGGVNLGNIYLSNPFNQRNQQLKNQSIKNNKLCETKPISEMLKMIVTIVYTMTNNNKPRTTNSKNKPNQTQFLKF